MDDQPCSREALREGLRRVCSVLKQNQLPFAVAGGAALWVHGARESDHDVDVLVGDHRVEEVVSCLDGAGFMVERPVEDWLFKAWWGPAMVDVIHQLHVGPVDEQVLARAREHEVLGLRIPVMPAQDVVREKLLTLHEQYCDFSPLLSVVRAVREQLDWAALVAETGHNELAFAFLVAAQRLKITGLDPSAAATADGAAPRGTSDRTGFGGRDAGYPNDRAADIGIQPVDARSGKA